MPDLTGEQKLRIVLESIIRKIPKEEQCQKYGISKRIFGLAGASNSKWWQDI